MHAVGALLAVVVNAEARPAAEGFCAFARRCVEIPGVAAALVSQRSAHGSPVAGNWDPAGWVDEGRAASGCARLPPSRRRVPRNQPAETDRRPPGRGPRAVGSGTRT